MSSKASLILFGGLAVLGMALTWYLRGADAVATRTWDAGLLLISILPHMALGLVIAGFLTVLIPREKVTRLFGDEKPLRGIATSTVIGAVIPGGPFASFPLVYALSKAGVRADALVAFLVAWATISVYRVFIWEIPFLGFEFGMLRLLANLPLPIVAGLVAVWLRRRYAVFQTL